MKRKGFIKSMLLAVIMLLGVGYAVVSSQTLTSNATITIGERAVKAEIVSGTLVDRGAVTLATGTIGNDGLTINFETIVDLSNTELDLAYFGFYIYFINNESDVNVEVDVTDVVIKIDGEDYETGLIIDDGFYDEEFGSYTNTLPPGVNSRYELFIRFDDDLDISFYTDVSISVTFTASVSE